MTFVAVVIFDPVVAENKVSVVAADLNIISAVAFDSEIVVIIDLTLLAVLVVVVGLYPSVGLEPCSFVHRGFGPLPPLPLFR